MVKIGGRCVWVDRGHAAGSCGDEWGGVGGDGREWEGAGEGDVWTGEDGGAVRGGDEGDVDRGEAGVVGVEGYSTGVGAGRGGRGGGDIGRGEEYLIDRQKEERGICEGWQVDM